MGRCPFEGTKEAGGSLAEKGQAFQGNLVFINILDGPGAPGSEVFYEGILAIVFAGIGLQQLGGVGVGNQHHGLSGYFGNQILQMTGSQYGKPFFQVTGTGVHEGFGTGGQQIAFFLQGFEPGFGCQLLGQGICRLDLGGYQRNQGAAVVQGNSHPPSAQGLEESHESAVAGGYNALEETGGICQYLGGLGAAVKNQNGGSI